jgi:hypothetical protein
VRVGDSAMSIAQVLAQLGVGFIASVKEPVVNVDAQWNRIDCLMMIILSRNSSHINTQTGEYKRPEDSRDSPVICSLERGSPWSRTDNSLEQRRSRCSGLATATEFQQNRLLTFQQR